MDYQQLLDDPRSKWICPDCKTVSPVQADKSITNNCAVVIDIPSINNSNGDLRKAKWGKLSSLEIATSVISAYKKVVKWRRNIFQVPSGQAGKAFIEEMTKTINFFTSSSNMESIAITMVMIMPALLLQKPSKKSKTKDHVAYLNKRLSWWKDGELNLLIREGEVIQKRLKNSKNTKEHQEKIFVRLMLQGKVSAALRWIGSNNTSVLDTTQKYVIDTLKEKHPPASPACDESILKGPKDKVEDVFYEDINADLIQECAKRMGGSAGPSGFDSDGWKRILCSKQFSAQANRLCDSIADLAKKLSISYVDPKYIHAFTACRLVPLDKKPGVRPVGIGEVLRRIVGKAITSVTKKEVVQATAPIQVCAGLAGGVEAAVHALRRIFNDTETDAVILVDADNAFNRLNRQTALHNIQYTCPEMAAYIINTYREPAKLIISNSDEELMSEEGVTQGDNCAMAKYSCSLMPLIVKLSVNDSTTPENNPKEVWYADDAAAGGKLESLKVWWAALCQTGPMFGYHPKPTKTWVIVKPGKEEEARALFPGLNVTSVGRRYLGSYIGTEEGKDDFINEKVVQWIKEIDEISEIAKREPQLAYSAYIFGICKRWNYVCRTTPNISTHLRKLEYKVRDTFIPAILDRAFSCTDLVRKIFTLPCREGGLSIHDLSQTTDMEYEYSRSATKELTDAIYHQVPEFTEDIRKMAEVKHEISKSRAAYYKEKRQEILPELNDIQTLQLDLAAEKGASSWLTSLPLQTFGYTLNKQEFNDALALRYNLKIKDAARKCVCGESNTINHLLVCKKGGYVSMRHNSLRDLIAELMTNSYCKDVSTEPILLPVDGLQLPRGANIAEEARLDIAARSVWSPLERAFFDVRVFHAPAPSNRALNTIARMYKTHETQKKTAYNVRVLEVEKGTFTPIVFSTTGGMGIEAQNLFKNIAVKMSNKTGQRYSETIGFIRKRLRFDLLKTTIIALRGYRGKKSEASEDIAELDLNLEPRQAGF